MPGLVILLLMALPFIEFWGFGQVMQRFDLGVFQIVMLTVATAMIGMFLVRFQGIGVVSRFRTSMARGEFPARAAFDGVCLLIAGLCLLLPGFVTDAVGVLLLFPPVRWVLFALAGRRSRSMSRSGTTVFVAGFPRQASPEGRRRAPPDPHQVVIDADFEEIEPDRSLPPKDSDSD
jgi:UPF0716 protein FxsA